MSDSGNDSRRGINDFLLDEETAERKRNARTLANLRGVRVEDLKEQTYDDVELALRRLGSRRELRLLAVHANPSIVLGWSTAPPKPSGWSAALSHARP